MIKATLLATTLFFAPSVALGAVLGDNTAGSIETMTDEEMKMLLQEADLVQKALFDARPEDLQKSIIEVDYNPRQVLRLKIRENSNLTFHFDEPISSYIVGAGEDFFTVQPFISGEKFEDLADGVVINNVFVARATAGQKDTNLTFLAKSGRIYTYLMRSINIDSHEIPHFRVHTTLPDDVKQEVAEAQALAAKEKRNTLREAAKRINFEQDNPFLNYMKEVIEGKINTNYKAKKKDDESLSIMPHAVFDNGVRTFFNFDGVTESNQIPVILRVQDGIDVPVQKKDAYMLDPAYKGWVYVEGLSQEGFTLKLGDAKKGKIICIKPAVNLREYHNTIPETVTQEASWGSEPKEPLMTEATISEAQE